MTLEQIRQSKSIDDLKPAIKYLCDKMQSMAWGEFNAYRGTLESQSTKLGVSLQEINALAEQYQIFGNMEVSK